MASLSLVNLQISQYQRVLTMSLGLDNPDIPQSQKVLVSTTLICLSLSTSVILRNGLHIDSCLLFINLTLFVKSICISVTLLVFSSHIKLVWPSLILVSVSTLRLNQKEVSVSFSILRQLKKSLSLIPSIRVSVLRFPT